MTQGEYRACPNFLPSINTLEFKDKMKFLYLFSLTTYLAIASYAHTLIPRNIGASPCQAQTLAGATSLQQPQTAQKVEIFDCRGVEFEKTKVLEVAAVAREKPISDSKKTDSYPRIFDKWLYPARGPYVLYPIMLDHEIYDRGDPGPYRVVFDKCWNVLDVLIANRNSYDSCNKCTLFFVHEFLA